MINNNIFSFLNDLKQNNNKEWFLNHKENHDAIKIHLETIVNELIIKLSKFDSEVSYLKAKDCLFRIYKDVRFSKDKTPYKTNVGIYIVNGGKKSGKAGYYINIEPDNCFIGGGVYMPQPDVLKKVRTEIYYNFNEFKKVISNSNFKKYFGQVSGRTISIAPKGFDKDFEGIEYLKFKDYTVINKVTEKYFLQNDFINNTVTVLKAMKPFNDFLNRSFD